MSFFERADALVSVGALFEHSTDLDMLVLVHAFEQHSDLRLDTDGNPTSLTMRRDAERMFRDLYDLSAEQYRALEQLVDIDGGIGNVYDAYVESLPPVTPGVAPALSGGLLRTAERGAPTRNASTYPGECDGRMLCSMV